MKKPRGRPKKRSIACEMIKVLTKPMSSKKENPKSNAESQSKNKESSCRNLSFERKKESIGPRAMIK